MNIRPQFITDSKGIKHSVILTLKEYNKLIEELELVEDIRLYNKAKKEDDGKRILFSDYLKKRKTTNGKIYPAPEQKSRKTVR